MTCKVCASTLSNVKLQIDLLDDLFYVEFLAS